METKYLRINPADNVAVAIVNLPAGEHLSVDGIEITLNEDIPAGHKFALKDFAEGENVIKYGYPIGHARMAKKQGDWMNETNIKTNLAGLLEYTPTIRLRSLWTSLIKTLLLKATAVKMVMSA